MDSLPSPETLALLGLVGLVAGFIDAIAGGGGLITLPSLLLVPLPPVQALATNKLQGSCGTVTAALTMLAKRQITLAEAWRPALTAFAGGAAGTLSVQWLPAGSLDVAVPFILMGIALYMLLAPRAGEVRGAPRLAEGPYRRWVVPLIGFYDGFLGPGTGSFFSVAGVALRGLPLISATAFAKVLNCATNLASLAVFVAGGKVVWTVGAVMAAGQMTGAYAGSHAAIRGGTRLIRPLIVTMCLAMTLRYLWKKGYLPLI